jgi:hypothetical protein
MRPGCRGWSIHGCSFWFWFLLCPIAAPCRYAWYKLYNLSKGYNKNLSAGDVQTLASNVLLSALAILPYRSAPFLPC